MQDSQPVGTNVFRNIPARLRAFASDRRGGTAMMFALSFVPLVFISGAAVDLGRQTLLSTKLKGAADAAALAAAAITSDNSNLYSSSLLAARQAAAQSTFNANISSVTALTGVTMQAVEIPNGVRVTASGTATNYFAGLMGMATSGLSTVSEAGIGVRSQMEIAFVLDNTGSMASNNKMPLLKIAMRKFLNKLQASVKTPGEVKVALVPFDTKVKIDPVFAGGKAWMRQSLTNLSGWTGCIEDRVQPYDTNATTPATMTPDTLFDAVDGALAVFPNAAPAYCGLPQMLPLTTNFSAYGASVDAMSPNGATNGTVGLVWGLHMLTPGDPFGAAANFGSVRKVIVFLTDGANTQSRYSSVAADIDARMALACSEIKSRGVELFTIGLMDANMSVLTPCATSSQMAFQVSNPSEIPDLFDMISQQLVLVRLTK